MTQADLHSRRASRAPAASACAAAAACLLCGIASAFSPGDVVTLTGGYDPNGPTTPDVYLVGYSPSGTCRGKVDLSNPVPYKAGYGLHFYTGLSLSPDGRHVFLVYTYDDGHGDVSLPLLVTVDILSANRTVTVRSIPLPASCSFNSGFAAAPGNAPGTYTLYASPTCSNRTVDDQSSILAYIWNANKRTLRLKGNIPYKGGLSKTGRKLSDYIQLFTIGASLYAVGLDAVPPSGSPNPLELYHVNTVSGAVTRQLSIPLAAGDSCITGLSFLLTIDSATSLYGVCITGGSTQPQVKLLRKGKAVKVVPLPFAGHNPTAVATLPSSQYLFVMSTPHVGPSGLPYTSNATITSLRKATGKVYKHSFTRPNINTFFGEMAVVPPDPSRRRKWA